jgi:hypothetical protein
MLFPAIPQNAADIRAFCARFNEGIRVEYKSTFDENVRRAVPKVVSSFANSLGGVLIIGVNAPDGAPQDPIEGFVARAEELRLTVESLCIQNISPSVFPRVTVVNGDLAGRVFLVIEVDDSWEAPHTIENSKRVYVRTGDAANPYDLAEVDLIIDLVRRRAEPQALRAKMLRMARERADLCLPNAAIQAQVGIAPLYPRRPLCTRDTTWDFLSTQPYRSGRFFPFNTLRRVEDGTASFDLNKQYGQLNVFGAILGREVMRHTREGDFLRVADPLHLILKLLVCAERFYRLVSYRGDFEVSLTLRNVRGQRLLFMPNVMLADLDQDDYRCYEDNVSGTQIVAAENLRDCLVETVQTLIAQVCWSFWQSPSVFPEDALREYIQQIVRDMRQL